jgi:hypothetical protein
MAADQKSQRDGTLMARAAQHPRDVRDHQPDKAYRA